MQLNLDLHTPTQPKKAWAFAMDKGRTRLRFKQAGPVDLSRCVITACSKEAKRFGVRAGMRLPQAKAHVPGLKILICNY